MNKCLARSNEGKTPQEFWIGQKPNIGHFKVLRCHAYTHVSFALRKKLEDKVEKCIFLKYSHETKGQKLYNPFIKKVIISKDVTFDE